MDRFQAVEYTVQKSMHDFLLLAITTVITQNVVDCTFDKSIKQCIIIVITIKNINNKNGSKDETWLKPLVLKVKLIYFQKFAASSTTLRLYRLD